MIAHVQLSNLPHIAKWTSVLFTVKMESPKVQTLGTVHADWRSCHIIINMSAAVIAYLWLGCIACYNSLHR